MKIRNATLYGHSSALWNECLRARECARIEVFGEYSYLRFNPTIPQLKNRSFNGGGGGVTFNITQHFGIKGELMGYGSTSFNVTTTAPIVTPKGTIPVAPSTPRKHVHLSVRTSSKSKWHSPLTGAPNYSRTGHPSGERRQSRALVPKHMLKEQRA